MTDQPIKIPADCNFFRFKEFGRHFLLTNDTGEHVFLTAEEFQLFINGRLPARRKKDLVKKNFFRGKKEEAQMAADYRERKNFLFYGPSLHIVVVTLRCNQNCVYCHASAKGMDASRLDMDEATADRVLDKIFSSPGKFLSIEFQGGEPLANWPVVRHIIAAARTRNEKAQKDLDIKLVTNLSLMDEEKYRYLIKARVGLCTSLDGPRELHDRNRPSAGRSGYDTAVRWIKKANRDYPRLLKKENYFYKPGALVTVSRFSLKYPRAIVDEYLRLGFDSIYLRPLNPFGFSALAWKRIGYSTDDYLEFYFQALDYILKINRQGRRMVERAAYFFLKKILTREDPNNLDLRSPCGAGIGQVAYNYNGDVYTCDEGRMLSMMGDDSFRIGNVHKNTYEEIVTHPVTRTICTASCLESLPACSDCAYLPYCGTCPIYNYVTQGNIFGQMPTNERCRLNKAIMDYLFYQRKFDDNRKIFQGWVKRKQIFA